MEPSRDQSLGERKTLISGRREGIAVRQTGKIAAAWVIGALAIQIVVLVLALFSAAAGAAYDKADSFYWPLETIGFFALAQIWVYAGLRLKFPVAARAFGLAAFLLWAVALPVAAGLVIILILALRGMHGFC